MSVADTLHDAVAELDTYIRDGADWGEASTDAPWHTELLDVRERIVRPVRRTPATTPASSPGWPASGVGATRRDGSGPGHRLVEVGL